MSFTTTNTTTTSTNTLISLACAGGRGDTSFPLCRRGTDPPDQSSERLTSHRPSGHGGSGQDEGYPPLTASRTPPSRFEFAGGGRQQEPMAPVVGGILGMWRAPLVDPEQARQAQELAHVRELARQQAHAQERELRIAQDQERRLQQAQQMASSLEEEAMVAQQAQQRAPQPPRAAGDGGYFSVQSAGGELTNIAASGSYLHQQLFSSG